MAITDNVTQRIPFQRSNLRFTSPVLALPNRPSESLTGLSAALVLYTVIKYRSQQAVSLLVQIFLMPSPLQLCNTPQVLLQDFNFSR